MTKLEKLYSTIKNLEELGIELPADVLKQTAELEESLIRKEILPVVRQQIEPVLCNIQRDLTFVVDYVPGVPVRVRISRKAGIYDNNDLLSTVIYKNKKYFYIKDALNNILGIINSDKQYIVSL